jgi:hypothetical protein
MVAGMLGRFLQRLRSSIDSFDIVFGLLPGVTGYAVAASWTTALLRGIRGEHRAADERRLMIASAAHIASRAVASATQVRGDVSMERSVTEMRALLHDAAREAEERDRRAAERDERAHGINVAMAWVAGLTLAAAIVTLVVTIAAG